MVKDISTITAEIADREAIRDCLYRYCRGIDRADAELLLSAFWPDATDAHGNFTAHSAQELVDHVMPILQSMDQTRHVLTNILIDIRGDVAYVESYVNGFHIMRKPDGTRYEHRAEARYIDQMERHANEWRIKNRTVVLDSVDWENGAFESMGYEKAKALNMGRRKPDDISYTLLKHTS